MLIFLVLLRSGLVCKKFMKESLEIKGYWYLPNREENRIAGILYYEPNETIRLELIGAFEGPMDYIKSLHIENDRAQDIVLGEDENGKALTLINCQKFGKLNFSSSFAMAKYTAHYLVHGTHLPIWDSAAFNKMRIRLPLLTQWVNHNGIRLSIPYLQNKLEGYDLSYRIEDQKNITAELPEDMTLSIEHHCNIPEAHSEESLLQQYYTVSFISGSNKSWWDFLNTAIRFKAFLSLATLEELDFSSIQLYRPDYYQEINDSKEKIYHPIKFLFVQPANDVQNTGKRKLKDLLFTHDNIEAEFPEIIKKWHGFDKLMMPILNHLAASIKNKSTFDSVDFLVVCQAIEGYHIRFIEKNNDFRKTLPKRIKHLTNTFKDIVKIRGIDIKAVGDSRNYYSHLSIESENDKVLTGHDLFNLTKKLRHLLICCILKEMGFDDSKIKKIVDK